MISAAWLRHLNLHLHRQLGVVQHLAVAKQLRHLLAGLVFPPTGEHEPGAAVALLYVRVVQQRQRPVAVPTGYLG